MHVLVAVDKFKGTLTAREVAAAISGGLTAAGVPSTALPLADGGDYLYSLMTPPSTHVRRSR